MASPNQKRASAARARTPSAKKGSLLGRAGRGAWQGVKMLGVGAAGLGALAYMVTLERQQDMRLLQKIRAAKSEDAKLDAIQRYRKRLRFTAQHGHAPSWYSP